MINELVALKLISQKNDFKLTENYSMKSLFTLRRTKTFQKVEI